jgi:stage II sporulation protein D
VLEVRPAALGGLNVVNALGLEDYVRGVVSAESPSTWPADALKAQAVAARTYAITTSKSGDGFDQYADTRSQVYRGVAAETPTTDAAVSETSGEVVTYQGRPVVTYFFSTSGGRTENAEYGFPGGEPSPWLKSVEDPYDDVSPRHRWGPFTFTRSQAQKRLRGLVQGKLKGIEVTARGVSPRVVTADVVGSKGRTPVTGATLRQRFGLFDTWAYFATIGTDVKPKDPPAADPTADPGTGAVEARAAAVSDVRRAVISGTVAGVKRGASVVVERRTGAGTWTTEVRTRLGKRGRYSASVARTGVYRIRVGGFTGPSVPLR